MAPAPAQRVAVAITKKRRRSRTRTLATRIGSWASSAVSSRGSDSTHVGGFVRCGQQTRHGLGRCSMMAVTPPINAQRRRNVAPASAPLAPASATGRPGPVLDDRIVIAVVGVLAVVLGWFITTYVGFHVWGRPGRRAHAQRSRLRLR